MNHLTYRHLSEKDKQQICAWKYDGDYAIYNLDSYEEMQTQHIGFANPKTEKNYYAFFDNDILVGFVNILEEPSEVSIGIGVAPALCGKHYGQKILLETYQLSKSLYPDKPLYLEVRTWNKRAITCYEHAGFQIEGEPYELKTGIGIGTFYRMIKK